MPLGAVGLSNGRFDRRKLFKESMLSNGFVLNLNLEMIADLKIT